MAAPLPWFVVCSTSRTRLSQLPLEWRISAVPSVEPSFTTISSKSVGSSVRSTSAIACSTRSRSLKTGIRIESIVGARE